MTSNNAYELFAAISMRVERSPCHANIGDLDRAFFQKNVDHKTLAISYSPTGTAEFSFRPDLRPELRRRLSVYFFGHDQGRGEEASGIFAIFLTLDALYVLLMKVLSSSTGMMRTWPAHRRELRRYNRARKLPA